MMDLKGMLGLLWDTTIEDLQFDMKNYRISFHALEVHEDLSEHRYSVIIDGVCGFSRMNDFHDELSHRYTDPMAYVDLSLASIQSDCNIRVIGTTVYNNYYSNANLAFEIWDSVMLIEAETITIDDQVFTLNGTRKSDEFMDNA